METPCDVCRHGWSAQQLFDQLQQDEFGQTGGLLPTDPRIQAATDTPAQLTAELFARLNCCLALVYSMKEQAKTVFRV